MSYLWLFLILFPCLYLVFWLFILFRFVSNHLFAQTGQLDLGVFVCWESACLAEQSCVSTSRLVAKCENSMQTLQNRICVSLSVRLRCLAAHLYLWSAQAQRCSPSENISEEHAIHATQIYLQEKEKEKVIKILGTHHLGSINVCSVQIHLTELEIFHYMRENSELLAVPEKMSGDHQSQLSQETMDIKKTSQQSI